MDIKAKCKNKEGAVTEVTVTKDLGATLQDKISLFTEAVVNDKAEDQLVVDIQAIMRRLWLAGKTEAEIQAYIDGVNFVAKAPRVGGAKKKGVDEMSLEELQALLARAKERMRALQQPTA